MSVNLKNAMHAAALAESLGDTEARASGVLSNTRPATSRIRRRRAAQQAGTSLVGAAAVAAIAVGGSAVRSHNAAAGGPGTALSKRAGAECGKPFNPTGKSDPRFSIPFSAPEFTIANPDVTVKNVSIWNEVVGLSQPSAKLSPSHPATAVFLKDGIVVGITDALTDWELMNPRATAGPGDDTSPGLTVPVTEMMNCTTTVPAKFTNDMFELVILSEYRVDGDSRTALVVAPPVKGPWVQEASTFKPPPSPPEAPDLNNSWSVFAVGGTDLVRGDQVEFRIGDYLAVKDTPGANVPLYYASPDGSFPNGSKPYTGPAEAHITDPGSLRVTFNGTKVFEWTEAEILPPR